jgi:hypothetical protein
MAFWNILFRNFFLLIWNLNSLFINRLLYKQSKPKKLTDSQICNAMSRETKVKRKIESQ